MNGKQRQEERTKNSVLMNNLRTYSTRRTRRRKFTTRNCEGKKISDLVAEVKKEIKK